MLLDAFATPAPVPNLSLMTEHHELRSELPSSRLGSQVHAFVIGFPLVYSLFAFVQRTGNILFHEREENFDQKKKKN